MYLQKKIISLIFVISSFSTIAPSFALTNKDVVITSIDMLSNSITTSISQQEKNLSDRAGEFGNKYDTSIISLGYRLDDIEALTSIKKMNAPSFRQEITTAYQATKENILKDIKITQKDLSNLRDEINLGFTDLSTAQKQSYEVKLGDIQNKYSVFLTGSSNSINNFTNTFSGRIAPSLELVFKMMRENGPYVTYIRDIRSRYTGIDEKKSIFLAKKTSLEKDILPKIQGGFLAFTTNKKTFTDAIRKDLTSGLEKALIQERIKKHETELRAYIEDIMSKWNEHLKKNFGQDDELVDATKDFENIITLEKSLHNRIYDTTGSFQPLDISGSSALVSEMTKLDAGMSNVNGILSLLISTYGTGNILASLSDKLLLSYNTELLVYRADFTKLLEGKLNTALLEEKNHAQILALLDQEEQILKQNLETTTSIDFTAQLVNNFIVKINALARTDGGADTLKKAKILSYRYTRTVVQKQIEDATLAPFYDKRIALDVSLKNLFISLEAKSGKQALLIKFPQVSGKIDALLSGKKISAKNRYTLLVVQSNLLKYMEDATN